MSERWIMAASLPREAPVSFRKLNLTLTADLHAEANISKSHALTILKSLCQDPAVAHRFVRYLSQKTWKRTKQGKVHSKHPAKRRNLTHQQLMIRCIWPEWAPGSKNQTRRFASNSVGLLNRMRIEQSEQKPITFGSVRIIHDWDLLLFENALSCLLNDPQCGTCSVSNGSVLRRTL